MGGIGIWQLLIVLAIVLVLFGAKRLRTLGGDLGSAVKGFRGAMRESGDASSDADKDTHKLEQAESGQVIDATVTERESSSKTG